MATTTTANIVVPEVYNDAVQGQFRRKNALIDSILVSSGAIAISGTMPESGARVVGKTVRCPYFGSIGEFEQVTEGNSLTARAIGQGYEDATVVHDGLAFEATIWARYAGEIAGMANDPYEEAARQTVESARRAMDTRMVAAGSTSPLLVNNYSATAPSYLTFAMLVAAKAMKLGDEQADGIVAMVTHSLGYADLVGEKDANGRPLHTTTVDGGLTRVDGMPVLQSDKVQLTGSTMGTVTSSGTTPPGITLSGTPTGPWVLHIDIVDAGTVGNATFRFSTDGGNTWSATLTTGASVALTDTATDSLVGNNGTTGITCAFTAGTHAADNLYVSTANICVETQIWMRGAGAFWFNQQALALKTDSDILKDSDVGAMHLYSAPKVYRRRAGGSRPGVVRIKHNVRSFVG